MRSTALATIPVGVLVERRKAKSPWADYLWRPISVLAGVPVTEAWTPMDGGKDVQLFYAGHALIELHRTETVYYRENLASGSPLLWVVIRPAEANAQLIAVTADPAEGEALTDAGHDIVETVAMPESVALTIQDFIAAHHVEQPFVKRRRSPPEHQVPSNGDGKERRRDG
ncbi:DUF3305 domain-containing protein [Phyllobacterium endophyticum]|uniref:DUF3305 domain-containing protein n=1 Tax=Phyllobacterium endophyticum TaxID=1149773 RepID=UPI0011CCACE2|nr:DUF3305 domain-containing protein [Phyllobacterium endophyticum]TXR47007.1 DUF3305 domain-containing protein [Phyllobacterium endophyticum]